MSGEAEQGADFAGLAALLVGDFDLAELLHRLAQASVSLCAAAGAGIMVADQDDMLQDVAYSSEDIRKLERYQLETDEGPCVECYRLGQAVEETDLAAAGDRWPRFAPEALKLGVRSARAVPLRLRGRTVGALNLFHAEPGPCPPELLRTAQGLADMAVVGIVQYGHGGTLAGSIESHIRTALLERSLIERAKGFLAELGSIGMDEAFRRLHVYADREGRGLTRIAQELSDRTLDAHRVLRLSLPEGVSGPG